MRFRLMVLGFLLLLFAGILLGVKLTIFSAGASEGQALDVAIAEYKKLHPEVEFEHVNITSGWQEKFSLALMSGDAPDLIAVTVPYADYFRSHLIDLAPYVEEYLGVSLKEYKDSMYDVVRVYVGKTEDELTYVPLYLTVHGLWVNVDYFEKAGIPYPPLGGRDEPWTWEEFVDVLRTVKKVNKLPAAMSFSYSSERLFNYLAVRGVKVLDENLDLVLDKDPRARKVLQDFVDLFKEELVPAPEWIAQQSDINDFLGGITAVHWSGSWMCRSITDIMKQTGKRFAPAYVPKDVDWFGINGGHILGVVKTGNKQEEEEAIKFALWVGQKGLGNDVFNKALLGISPFKDHKIDYGVPEMNEWIPVFQTLIERAPSWIVPVRTCELWARLYDPLRTQIAMVIGDQQSLDDALKNIRKEYETILEELGEKR